MGEGLARFIPFPFLCLWLKGRILNLISFLSSPLIRIRLEKDVTMKRILFSCLVALLLIETPAMAHGGPGVEMSGCVLHFGDYKMHFSTYQPEIVGSKQMCMDLPMAGKAILVFDLVENSLRNWLVKVQVVEEQTTSGGNQKVILEKPAQTYPTGTITLRTNFEKPGHYVAIVTLDDEKNGDQPITVEVPLHVGQDTEATLWAVAFIFAIVVFGLIFWQRSREEKAKAALS